MKSKFRELFDGQAFIYKDGDSVERLFLKSTNKDCLAMNLDNGRVFRFPGEVEVVPVCIDIKITERFEE